MVHNRIALLMPDFSGGGAERIMLTLAQGIASRGYALDLVVACGCGPLADQVPAGLRLFDLRSRRIIVSLPALVQYLRRERPMALLSALPPTNCLAVWAKQLAKVSTRLIVAQHGTQGLFGETANSRRELVLPFLMRRAYPKADNIVAVSKGVAEHLVQVIGLQSTKVEVVYNPVVTARTLALSNEVVDHPWFADSEPPVILGVGRLTRQKDFSNLVRAFAEVRQHRQVRLIILGEGEDRKVLEYLAKDLGVREEIDLPGFVHNPYAYMRAASLLALSSLWEGLPTVLIEAMACGTPVVATDCPSGPSEILENGQWGDLVPVGDSSALARAIMKNLAKGGACFGVTDRSEQFTEQEAIDKYCSLLVVNN